MINLPTYLINPSEPFLFTNTIYLCRPYLGTHLPAIHIPIPVDRVASVMGLLRGTSFAADSANSSAKLSVKQGPTAPISGSQPHVLVPIDEHGTPDEDEAMLDRLGMASIKQETFLKSHRSFTDLYDMCSSHQYEVIRPGLTMTQRRASFPSFAKME